MTAKIKAPSLPAHLDETQDFRPAWEEAVYSESEITGWHFKDLELQAEDLTGLTFSGVILENCRLLGCQLDKSSFIDAVFRRCDLSNSTFGDSYFKRCQWQDCKGLGAGFINAHLEHLQIQGSNLQYANFDETYFLEAAFTASDLSQANFSKCRFKNVDFAQCRIYGTSFFGTALRGLDFCGSDLEGLIVSDDAHELQGLIVDPLQAAELAKLLGIVIKS